MKFVFYLNLKQKEYEVDTLSEDWETPWDKDGWGFSGQVAMATRYKWNRQTPKPSRSRCDSGGIH